jgi:uncharacterized protein YaaN involved in tellurite resistance
MSEKLRTKAEALTSEISALVDTPLAEPSKELVILDTASEDDAQAITRRMAEIDIHQTGSIIGFGSRAQLDLQQISQSMLADVKSKDLGPAGDGLREMVTTLRGFSVSELDTRRQRSWWERLTGKAAPLAKFQERYATVQGQIDRITGNLLNHETTLLKDIKALDKLYEKTLEFYHELALYIAAGEAKIKHLDAHDIPAKC